MIRAVGLLSGGLDSTLAAKVLIDQGIEVHAINFVTPFCTCTPKSAGCAAVEKAVGQLGNIPLKRVALGDEYLEIVRSPRHGHGRGLNPCLDCRALKIRKAAEHMAEIGASFLFTGEVLGQRPMSQHRRAMAIIDKHSGVGDLTLRPLSAMHFEPTLPEREGWVDRSKLLGIEGRSRKVQIALAKEKNIVDYPCPAGGCLLTDERFAAKLTDYFAHCEKPSIRDMPLLKIGRHFRNERGAKTIVGRDEHEGLMMERLAPPAMHLYYPVNFGGPHILADEPYGDAIRELFYKYGKVPEGGEASVEWVFAGEKKVCVL
jgi:tRNA U34 2-thiouridine synthase MnmA/TrmU